MNKNYFMNLKLRGQSIKQIKFNEQSSVLIILFGLLILFTVLLFLSDGFMGGADNLTHFRYSRYAYQNPRLFLWHWGKPLFTILSSPFAQLGFRGIQFFNILCGLLSAYLSYLICRKLHMRNAILVIFFVSFLPIYTVMMLSGMTEILFSTVLTLSIYFFVKNKFILSAIVISLLPFVRTEGIFIIPVIGLALLISKQYKAVPFLLFGILAFSLIGWPVYSDFFWLINKMPYTGYKVYGTGSFFHFVGTAYFYLGNILLILAIAGILHIIIKYVHRDKTGTLLFFLIMLPFMTYFTAHSFMWWSGSGTSLGLHRYMAGVSPFIAIIALSGFNLFDRLIRFLGYRWLRWIYFISVPVLIVWYPFNRYKIPVPLDSSQKAIEKFAGWYDSSKYANRKIYYFNPEITYFLKINPYDKSKCRGLVYNNQNPHKKIRQGELIVWDSKYSKSHGLYLKTLRNDKNLRFVNKFGGNKVYVFERIKEAS
jgi:Gpi18-like mannosyltransferase